MRAKYPRLPCCRGALCLFWALLLAAGSLVSCGGEAPPRPAAAVLSDMLAALPVGGDAPEGAAASGTVYDRAGSSAAGGASALTDTLLSALYGPAMPALLAAAEGERASVSDAAVFLSMTASPRELAVFRCADARTAATVAKLCRARLDVVRRARAGTEWSALAEGGLVTVSGPYVLLVIAEDAGAVAAAAG